MSDLNLTTILITLYVNIVNDPKVMQLNKVTFIHVMLFILHLFDLKYGGKEVLQHAIPFVLECKQARKVHL